MNDNEVPVYAYSKKGVRALGQKKGWRNQRVSVISFSHKNKFIQPLVFDGYCNRDVVLMYLREVLGPVLKPGMTLVLDNASFHKGSAIHEACQEFGCKVLYLPPYSPELNPIEKLWASIKHRARAFLSQGFSLFDALSKALVPKIGELTF